MKHNFKRLLSACLVLGLCLGLAPTTVQAEETPQSGTFTAVSMNVDGLPQKIAGLIDLNKDGPGSEGTKAISQKMGEYGWDIIGVSEDFNYNSELMSALNSNYNSGTHRGGVSWLTNDTDGLNLIWKKSLQVTGESWTKWNTQYSTGFANTGNGADGMINKGFRYYEATVAEGVSVDVYILHMDADSDQGDIDARESQLQQLVDAIKASDNKNPIVIMGDTNCRYTREHLEELLIGGINEDPRFTIQDTWVEKVWNGVYPQYGADAMVAKDKGGTYDYPQAEIVDKIFYINNTDSDVTLTCNSHTVETSFVNASGTALADHWPVVVEFGYTKAHEHSWDNGTVTIPATCTQEGVRTYTCTSCAETKTESIPAIGHTVIKDVAVEPTCTETGLTEGAHCAVCNQVLIPQEVIPASGHEFENGVCIICGAEDPSEMPQNGILGEKVTQIESGKQYAVVFQGTTGNFSMRREGLTIQAEKFTTAVGEELDEELIWTVTQDGNGYTITTEINGQTYYLYRTTSYTGVGYCVGLQTEKFVWDMTYQNSKQSFRFYTKAPSGTAYYLRYYSARQGWQASYTAAGVKLYEVNEAI